VAVERVFLAKGQMELVVEWLLQVEVGVLVELLDQILSVLILVVFMEAVVVLGMMMHFQRVGMVLAVQLELSGVLGVLIHQQTLLMYKI
jgi:hypothetical protein